MARQSSDQMIKRSDGQMINGWMIGWPNYQIFKQLDGQMVE